MSNPSDAPKQSNESQASPNVSSAPTPNEQSASPGKSHEEPASHQKSGGTGTKQRAKKNRPELPVMETFGEYVRGLRDGIAYCFTQPSVLGLIFFEAAFWAIGAAFCVLLVLRAEYVLNGSDAILFSSRALACTGMALLVSAFFVRKFTGKISPIVTYMPALLLVACGAYGVFIRQT